MIFPCDYFTVHCATFLGCESDYCNSSWHLSRVRGDKYWNWCRCVQRTDFAGLFSVWCSGNYQRNKFKARIYMYTNIVVFTTFTLCHQLIMHQNGQHLPIMHTPHQLQTKLEIRISCSTASHLSSIGLHSNKRFYLLWVELLRGLQKKFCLISTKRTERTTPYWGYYSLWSLNFL